MHTRDTQPPSGCCVTALAEFHRRYVLLAGILAKHALATKWGGIG